jgi:phosphatidylglycerophosphate synthase
VPKAPVTPPLSQFVARRFAVRSPFWSWHVFERLGGAVAFVFARLGVSPTVATMLGGLFGIVGATLLGTASDAPDVLLAGAVLLVAYTLDCADGQLARATGTSSAKGAWLDVTTDAVTLAFLAASLCVGLLVDGASPLTSLLIAGAFGAARSASLFTASRVRNDEGGIRLTGAAATLRSVATAAVDTPFVYVVLCASRLSPTGFRTVILAITLLTGIRTVVSARHHFATRTERPT